MDDIRRAPSGGDGGGNGNGTAVCRSFRSRSFFMSVHSSTTSISTRGARAGADCVSDRMFPLLIRFTLCWLNPEFPVTLFHSDPQTRSRARSRSREMLSSRDARRIATGRGSSGGCRSLRNTGGWAWFINGLSSRSGFLRGAFEVNVGFDSPVVVSSVFGWLSMSRSRSGMAIGWCSMRLLSGLTCFVFECLPRSQSRSRSQ